MYHHAVSLINPLGFPRLGHSSFSDFNLEQPLLVFRIKYPSILFFESVKLLALSNFCS